MINGVVPLFLFPQHWEMTKIKAKEALSLTVTNYKNAFADDMLFNLPFLAYSKAMQKARAGFSHMQRSSKVFRVIEHTCVSILKFERDFLQVVAQRIFDFAFQKKRSTRTMDVVQSVKVLLV